MVDSNQWKEIMKNGVAGAHLFDTISIEERRLLESSIDAPINTARMERDTEYRLRRNK